MRVVAEASFKTYFQMVCIDVTEGDELEGDFADFLLAGGAPVGPAGAAEAPEAEPPADPTPDDEADGEQGEEPDDELDIGGTANDVLEWVGDDPRRAAAARAAESAKDKPRSTLLQKLDAIAGP